MTGTRIGQYRVLQLLGEGGMGRVLLCEHAVIGTRHAVKMLHDEFSKNEMVVQRFLNEARAASAIGHRNVVEITHADQVDGQGPWYLVMKYLTGQTLSAFLASRTAPPDQRLIATAALLSRPGSPGEPAQRSQAADAPSFSQARMPTRAPEPSVTVAASAPSDPRAVDGGAPAAAAAPKAPAAAAAAPTPAVAASVKELSSAATSRPAHAPVDAGVPDAAVIAAPQPPTAHESPAADPGSNAPGAAPVGTGRLTIVILPRAEAWLDGKPLGQTPIVGLKVAAGVHRIRLPPQERQQGLEVNSISQIALL